MPWPQYSRTTEKPSVRRKLWITWPRSPRRVPGRTSRMPRHMASKPTWHSRRAWTEMLPDQEHAAGVAVEAILDDGDVHVDDVAGPEHPVPGDAVADHVVDRSADGLRETLVIQGCRDCLLGLHDEIVADPVELAGGDAGLDRRADHVQHVRRQPSGNAHRLLFGGRLDRNPVMAWHQHGLRAAGRGPRKCAYHVVSTGQRWYKARRFFSTKSTRVSSRAAGCRTEKSGCRMRIRGGLTRKE